MPDFVNTPRRPASRFSRWSVLIPLAALCLVCLSAGIANATIIATSGTVTLEPSPFPPESDSVIYAFDEQQSVLFVSTQALDFGNIAPGTLVNSHYIQYDTDSATGTVGPGSVTFDGVILGVITSTANLTADLSPDVLGTSDTYFGLEDLLLLPYPAGAPGTEQFRGLGSPMDDLVINIGSNTLVINGLEIETPGALDGIRVLTAVPEPGTAWLVASGMLGLAARRPRSGTGRGPRRASS